MEEDLEFLNDDIIDWNDLLGELPEGANALELETPVLNDSSSSSSSSPLPDVFSNRSSASLSSWIGHIETLLMKEDDDKVVSVSDPACDDFLAEVLVNSPTEASPLDVDASADKDSNEASKSNSDEEKLDVEYVDDHDAECADDPISKKRRRQLRNRDAAVRSRERKKIYVKDLELKSKYLEGECRRLGRLLQCCYAENQALRFSLQMGYSSGASATKQESAVLLLESLLLGSLLWLLVIMCLFTLPVMPLRNLEPLQVGDEGKKAPESVAPRGAESKIFGYVVVQSFVRGRRCKASWTKMKHCVHVV